MPFQPVPGTAKFSVVYDRAGPLMVNVFHFDREGQWGLPELTSGATLVAAMIKDHVMPHLQQAVRLSAVEARGLRAPDDVSTVVTPIETVMGGTGDQLSPGNVAFVVTHITGLAGRSARGRTYFGGLSEANIAGDGISVVKAIALAQALYALKDAMAAQGWRMVVVSRRANKQLRSEGYKYPVESFRFKDLILDSQRRRLSGRGR